MSAEPGWYHADGDPEGTVRLWNGSEWVGFPQRDPNIAVATHGADPEAAEGPTPGQVRLKPLTIAVQVALAANVFAIVYVIYSLLVGLSTIGDVERLNATISDRELKPFTDVFVTATIVSLGATLLCGVLFVTWMWLAYRNVGLWHKTKHGASWTLWGWIVPFLNLVRPISMMLEIVEHSPRKSDRGALSPITAVVWWLLFMLPQLLELVLRIPDSDTISTLRFIFWLSIGTSVATIGSAVVAIFMIDKITWFQDRRFTG